MKKQEEQKERQWEEERTFVPVANIFYDFSMEQGDTRVGLLGSHIWQRVPNPPIPSPCWDIDTFPMTRFYALSISNTVGVEILCFKKWAKMGISAFVEHEYRKYDQPLMNWADATRLEIDEIERNAAAENTV